MKKFLTILLSVMLLVGCLTVNAFAADGLAITVEADKTEVAAGDTVNYTVYLENGDKLANGIFAYEFVLVIPEGLTYVANSAVVKAADLGFNMPQFNANTMKGTSGLGAFGQGFTGAKGVVMTFQCTVDADATGELKVELTNTKIGDGTAGVAHEAIGATVALHEHSYTAAWTWAADYSAASLKLTCACGDNHTVDATVTSVANSTCTDAGVVTYTATAEFGGESYTDVKEAAGTLLPHKHTAPTFVWADDYSCVAVYGCENCDTPFEKAATVTSAVVEGTGSCTVPMTVRYTATVEIDGQSYTDTKDGLGEDLLPHKHTAPTFVWADDYSCVAVYGCENCDTPFEKAATVTSAVVEGTGSCTEPVTVLYTATVEIDGQSYTDTKEGLGDVLPHEYTAEWTWAEDYTSVSVVLTCVCGDTIEKSSEAGEVKIDTVYKDGKAYITATVWIDGVAYTNTVVIDWEPAPETADSFSAIYMMSALIAAAGAVLVLKKKVQG